MNRYRTKLQVNAKNVILLKRKKTVSRREYFSDRMWVATFNRLKSGAFENEVETNPPFFVKMALITSFDSKAVQVRLIDIERVKKENKPNRQFLQWRN